MADDIRTQDLNTNDLVGYRVDATDGHVGRVHASTVETPLSSFVVETGHVVHRPHLLPARVIADVDHRRRVVTVRLSKRDVRRAAEYLGQDSFERAIADEQESSGS